MKLISCCNKAFEKSTNLNHKIFDMRTEEMAQAREQLVDGGEQTNVHRVGWMDLRIGQQ